MSEERSQRRQKQSSAGDADKPPREDVAGLVVEAQQGSIDAFQSLYGNFSRKLLNYLYRMTGSREEAEDLAQDTFVLAYRKLETLKEPGKFQSWLFRIAQNNVYQRYRGKHPQIESIDAEESSELSDVQRMTTPWNSPEAEVLSDELEDMIEAAIADLPEKYRTVFVLSAVQKLSYQEISEIVERSLASVKSDIHRARVAVRDRVKKYLGGDHGMSNVQ